MNMNWLTLATATEGGGAGVEIGNFDIAIIVIYLLVIVGLGCFVGVWKRRNSNGAAKDYFLAGGTLRWPIIGLALFATNISCVHLVSLAQAGYDTGLLYGNFEWMAALTLVMLGVLFAPFYIRSKVSTLPDFLERRYNRSCRDWLAVLSIVSAVIVHIGFSFLTGGKVLEFLFGVNIYTSIIVIAVLTGLYTIIGGLMAVVVTEAIQTVILVLGATLITWFAWDKMGGWEPVKQVLEVKNIFGDDNQVMLSMLRSKGELGGLPWYSILLGYPVLGIWYWCADQTIVQRVLGAKSEDHARIGPIFAGLIKILPVFIFVLPGLFAFTLAQSDKLDTSKMIEKGKVDFSYALLLTNEIEKKTVTKLEAAGLYSEGHVTDIDKALQGELIEGSLAKLLKTKQMLATFTLDETTISGLDKAGLYKAGQVTDLNLAVQDNLLDKLTAEKLKAKKIISQFKLDKKTMDGLKKEEVYSDKNILDLKKAEDEKIVVDETTKAMAATFGDPVYDTKKVYGVMITQLMPKNVGLMGLMIAALLAALMSTVSGALNSISTLFSYDLYKRFKPDTTDVKLVLIGRIAAFVALLAAIGLVPLLDGYESIFKGLNDIIGHIAPPVTCVFMLGVFWPRASAMSAKLTLWFGSSLGVAVFLIGKLAEKSAVAIWLKEFTEGSFMMMAFYLFCACVTMQVVFTMIWPAGESERSSKLYWEHPLEPLEAKGWPGIGNYKFLSCLLLGVMAVLYYFFR